MTSSKIRTLLELYQKGQLKGKNRFPDFNSKSCLDLARCSLTDEDIPELCVFLLRNPQICQLILTDNSISDEGVIRLNQITSLIYLELGCNNITDSGAKVLSENPTIEKLGLRQNHLTNDCIKSFLANRMLGNLFLSENNIDKDQIEKVTQHVNKNFARQKQFSRLYGQVIRSYDKEPLSLNLRNRYLAHQVFSLVVAPTLFQSTHQIRYVNIGLEQFGIKPQAKTK